VRVVHWSRVGARLFLYSYFIIPIRIPQTLIYLYISIEILLRQVSVFRITWTQLNELLVLSEPNGSWEFVMLLHAHKTAESAELLIQTMDSDVREIMTRISLSIDKAFKSLEDYLIVCV
jgi:hypothetical protein